MDWLNAHNPDVDWKKKQLNLTRCPKECETKMIRTLRNGIDSVETDEIADDEDVISDEEDLEYQDGDRLLVIDTVAHKTVPMF
jgi:hypothetical protein